MTALCAGKSDLFLSTHPSDHLIARDLCARCPFFSECERIRDSCGQDTLEGTWAGQLYGLKKRARIRWEESMFTDDEARVCHALYEAARAAGTLGELEESVRTGARVYDRRRKMRQRRAAA